MCIAVMSWCMWLIVTVILLYLLRNIYLPVPVALYGKYYSKRGPWYFEKRAVFTLLMKLRKWKVERNASQSDAAGYGVRSRDKIEDMDRAQKLDNTPKAVDAVYFNGSNKDGAYIITAVSRRPKKVAQLVLFLYIPDVGLFQLPEHPDSTVYECNPDRHEAGGLCIEVVTPMKEWKITYNGKLRKGPRNEWSDDDTDLVTAKFEFIWISYTDIYDFDVDQHPDTIIDAVAKQPWSREFFRLLRDAHQTHYEQFGEWKGKVQLEGHNDIELNMKGMRDHSYGKHREWGDFHRYGIHMIHLEDGTSINLGKICLPETLSDLSIGYVMNTKGKKEAISWTDMDLPTLGEEGIPPKEYQVNFLAGEKKYNMKVQVHRAPIFYMGFGWEARIYEQMVSVNVNGQKGRGIAEFLYRYYLGCPRDAQLSFD
ncbi:uncharacterized protein LOC100372656 [Saccoglossus kowalevskii]|uniref:Uncharacterized protein LOC100372656 n=1 Tax=Saccoglossus kowalevskii TaxID=10224 RepID=A0ABM0GKK1_SACKO|nr:PREDICTED: uncharacterized protein LOC100372656 [Saccoglossus kowalevskii]